jgi:hypothetical protein
MSKLFHRGKTKKRGLKRPTELPDKSKEPKKDKK